MKEHSISEVWRARQNGSSVYGIHEIILSVEWKKLTLKARDIHYGTMIEKPGFGEKGTWRKLSAA